MTRFQLVHSKAQDRRSRLSGRVLIAEAQVRLQERQQEALEAQDEDLILWYGDGQSFLRLFTISVKNDELCH